MSGTRVGIAVAALAFGMAGCDRAWQQYEGIRIGEPLPEQTALPLRPVTVPPWLHGGLAAGTGRRVCTNEGIWPVPLSSGRNALAVDTDAEGRVIAKSYRAAALSNYGIFSAAAKRRVLELHVPQALLDEPAAELEPLRSVPYQGHRTLRQYLYWALQKVDADDDWGPHLDGFLMGPPGIDGMIASNAFNEYLDLGYFIKKLPLDGLERVGYDRTFRPIVGGSIRVRNLGQQRVRVEMNMLRLYDPLGVVALTAMAHRALNDERRRLVEETTPPPIGSADTPDASARP